MQATLESQQVKASRAQKHHKDKGILQIVKTINYVGILIDLLAIIIFAVVLILMFGAIKIPLTTNEMENPELVLQQYYMVAGYMYSSKTVNLIISIMAVFLIVGVSTFVVNLNHIRGLEAYDYHRWEAGNRFTHAFMSLLTFNLASFVVKLIGAELLMQYAEGMTTFEWLKLTYQNKKAKRALEKERKLDHVATEEELEIRRKVRVQVFLKIIRYSITYIFLILVAVFVIIPFYWMILTSLKTYQESKASNPSF